MAQKTCDRRGVRRLTRRDVALAEGRAESRDEFVERALNAAEAVGKNNLSYSLANKERQLHSL